MKLFQIYEDDLAALEADAPWLCERLVFTLAMDNAARIRIRRLKSILTNVRWNYGPPSEVERIDAGEDGGSNASH